ncbi:MAG: type II secretion system protein GspK [Candidatus Omnitrophica bacterium]|nr:type II secretion system protein GspK [Candidatus Omnitrophota bacterium]
MTKKSGTSTGSVLSRTKSRDGTILITTIWILAILSILAVGIGFRVSLEARLSKYNMDRLKAVYYAKAGIVKAQAMLLKDSTPGYDTIRECGITVPFDKDVRSVFTEKLADGGFEVNYEEAGKTYYGMTDEERKININKADQLVLTTLLGKDNKAAEENRDYENVAASIVNWRGMARAPGGGAWDDDYETLAAPYKCKHADFSAIEELMLVKGMKPELFDSIKDYVTVYGDGKVNINTATERVMRACGLGENLIAGIMNVRNGRDLTAGTKDDGLVNDITPEAAARWNIAFDANEKNALNNFTTGSNYFRIESKGAVDRSKISARIVCVIDRKAKRLKYYREY